MKSASKKPRGRPVAPVQGAGAAFDFVERYRKRHGLTQNALALSFGMTPSTVSRALADRSTARLTPGLRQLYSIAKNRTDPAELERLQRLSAYSGPGEEALKRLLADVDALIAALSRP
jgi:transcriptional regulator with XRE-family HTH domain